MMDAGANSHGEAGFFKEFAGEGFLRRFAWFRTAAREFPFVSVVAEKEHFGGSGDGSEQDALDGYGK